MDMQRFWADVRSLVEKMPDQKTYYLASLDHPDKGTTAGAVSEVADRKLAAKLIVGRTHIFATEEQIFDHLARQDKAAQDLAAIEQKRKGQLAMPQELQDLVRLAAHGVQAQQPNPPAKPANKEK